MSLTLKFRWSDARGEGLANKIDSNRLLEEDWLIAADFLSDVIWEAEALYNKILENARADGAVMEVLSHRPKKELKS